MGSSSWTPTKPGWEDDVESAFYVEHLIDAQTQLPFEREPFVARTLVANQSEIEIEIWEQAGASPGREMAAIIPGTPVARIKDLGVVLPACGSPINMEINVDGEGTVHLRAVEPASNHEATLTVRISIGRPGG